MASKITTTALETLYNTAKANAFLFPEKKQLLYESLKSYMKNICPNANIDDSMLDTFYNMNIPSSNFVNSVLAHYKCKKTKAKSNSSKSSTKTDTGKDDAVVQTGSSCSLESGIMNKYKCHYKSNPVVKYGTWAVIAVAGYQISKKVF